VSGSQLATVYAAAFPIDKVLSMAWLPEPRFQSADHFGRFRASKLPLPVEIASSALVDIVELANESERDLRFGVIGAASSNSVDVGPTAPRARCQAHPERPLRL
jgi:hypothetical protein